MPSRVIIHGKTFRKYIPKDQIQKTVERLAAEINIDRFNSSTGLIVCPVLTGSMLFAADLVQCLDGVEAIKPVIYKSYSGTESTGQVNRLLPFPESVAGKDVLIVEDIVDSGLTVQTMIEDLQKLNPASVSICTLLFKPESFKGNYNIDYCGYKIGTDFVVGYGMDYDEIGRNLRDIYMLDESQCKSLSSI